MKKSIKLNTIIQVLLIVGILGISLCVLEMLKRRTVREGFEDYASKDLYFMTNQKKNGRFGNNVIQYMAAKIIQKLYGFKKVISIETLPESPTVIDDNSFANIMQDHYAKKSLPILDITKPVVLEGYYQRSDLLTPMRDYIKSIFNSENCENINSKYKVCDIMNHKSPVNDKYDPEQDLVMHVRLDDFKTHGTSGIFNTDDIKHKILRNIKYRRFFIVCDNLRHDWEKEYMKGYDELSPILVQGSLLDDYVFIKNAKRLVLSNSSFCWSAGFIGNATEIHIPLNPNQFNTMYHLGCYIDNCKTYSDLECKIG